LETKSRALNALLAAKLVADSQTPARAFDKRPYAVAFHPGRHVRF
jgi:hypothetical protein